MSRDVLQDLNSNWSAWLSSMAEHVPGGKVQSFGGILGASVGVPIPLFNQVFVFAEPTVPELEQALSWMGERGVPFWFTAPPSSAAAVRELAEVVGLARSTESMPGMSIALSDHSPEPGGDLEIVAVTASEQLEAVAAVLSAGFQAPLEVALGLSPVSMLDDDRMAWVVGYCEGEPAACGQLMQTDDVAGVYSIAVPERFRRRGFGEAISRAVLSAGHERGCEIGVLQASPMGRPVYERMGFDLVADYNLFTPAS